MKLIQKQINGARHEAYALLVGKKELNLIKGMAKTLLINLPKSLELSQIRNRAKNIAGVIDKIERE